MKSIQIQKKQNYEFLKTVSKEKGIAFAIMCIERQLKVYEKACRNHKWGYENFYQNALNECWKYAIEHKSFQKDLLDLCDQYMPENLEPDIPMDDATIGATNAIISIISLIEVIINDDMERLLGITLENIKFINKFLCNSILNIIPSKDDDKAVDSHELMLREIEVQNTDKEKIQECSNIFELKDYFENRMISSVLGEYWYD